MPKSKHKIITKKTTESLLRASYYNNNKKYTHGFLVECDKDDSESDESRTTKF